SRHEQLGCKLIRGTLVAPVVIGRFTMSDRRRNIDMEVVVMPQQVVAELVADRETLPAVGELIPVEPDHGAGLQLDQETRNGRVVPEVITEDTHATPASK